MCCEFIKQEADILDWKRGEYATNEDRLQNFREVAVFVGCSMQDEALAWGRKNVKVVHEK